jgi:hypothetical protein
MRLAVALIALSACTAPAYALMPVGAPAAMDEACWGGFYCIEREPPHRPRIRHGCIPFWEQRLALDAAIEHPGADADEGRYLLGDYDMGIRLGRYCRDGECFYFRVYQRYLPLSRHSLPHSVIEMQVVGEAPVHLRGWKLDR